jgi:type II secretory pathway pseudopilin PulG
MSSGSQGQQSGFTYVFALLLVALTGAGAAAIAETWSHARQREKEAELRWVGNQIKQAIGLYYQRSPGTLKRYPESLENLLEDRRFLTMQRYLRRLYADPLTGKADWQLVLSPAGGIMGVRSKGRAVTLEPVFVYEPPVTSARSTSR